MLSPELSFVCEYVCVCPRGEGMEGGKGSDGDGWFEIDVDPWTNGDDDDVRSEIGSTPPNRNSI